MFTPKRYPERRIAFSEPHVQRMYSELRQLAVLHNKLRAFIDAPPLGVSISVDERADMVDQLAAMRSYLAALERRVDRAIPFANDAKVVVCFYSEPCAEDPLGLTHKLSAVYLGDFDPERCDLDRPAQVLTVAQATEQFPLARAV